MIDRYQTMLSVENLSFRYPHAQQDTLRRLTFTIARGEIFGFLGPSGSGKSTTQKILYKLLSGYQGDIRFEGNRSSSGTARSTSGSASALSCRTIT
jgi:fluoroquinolone transport system ATP-binding protein